MQTVSHFDRLDKAYSSILLDIYACTIHSIIFISTYDDDFFGGGVRALIYRDCMGCELNCGSQKHHDICTLHYIYQVEYLYASALSELDENQIEIQFFSKILEGGLPPIDKKSGFRHFMQPHWRKNFFLVNFEEEIKGKVVHKQHIYRGDDQNLNICLRKG